MIVHIVAKDNGQGRGAVRPLAWLVSLLVLGLFVAGCGEPVVTGEPEPTRQTEAQLSPLVADSPVPTPTPLPSDTPTPTPRPRPSPGQLVLLHTNDNWGETEPCG